MLQRFSPGIAESPDAMWCDGLSQHKCEQVENYTTLVPEYIVVMVSFNFRSAPKARSRASAGAPALEQEPNLLPELAHTTRLG